ncbi:nuclear transport factor 2 family protein [Streptomyces roseirectus]|uniref:Nuclear transport factor 2 family protein n=1 Tax=Streptomyces roseirectus TaxID=2768066 RepID=A0A7H0IE98_9ACTN|nr:nuclear transport factor 2 family protein [Streptomyces roseirectus]QNP71114.1 nuclear transport factor 2 family protein [Streptomyces roseirectus]
MSENISNLVDRFLRVLEKYDFSAAEEMCTEKATVWQNDGKPEQLIGERLTQFRSFVTTVESMRYDVLRRFDDGEAVLQQQVLHLNMTDGTSSALNALLYFRFEDGLIDRIEEYVYAMPAPGEAA